MKFPPLKGFRLRRGLRQADLAREVGVSQAMISRLESGRHTPSPETRAALAGFFGVPIDVIFGGELVLVGVSK